MKRPKDYGSDYQSQNISEIEKFRYSVARAKTARRNMTKNRIVLILGLIELFIMLGVIGFGIYVMVSGPNQDNYLDLLFIFATFTSGNLFYSILMGMTYATFFLGLISLIRYITGRRHVKGVYPRTPFGWQSAFYASVSVILSTRFLYCYPNYRVIICVAMAVTLVMALSATIIEFTVSLYGYE